MMHEFLSRNRAELIERCRLKVAARPSPKAEKNEDLENGVPLFFDQLIKTLLVEQSAEPLRSRKVSGESGGEIGGLGNGGIGGTTWRRVAPAGF